MTDRTLLIPGTRVRVRGTVGVQGTLVSPATAVNTHLGAGATTQARYIRDHGEFYLRLDESVPNRDSYYFSPFYVVSSPDELEIMTEPAAPVPAMAAPPPFPVGTRVRSGGFHGVLVDVETVQTTLGAAHRFFAQIGDTSPNQVWIRLDPPLPAGLAFTPFYVASIATTERVAPPPPLPTTPEGPHEWIFMTGGATAATWQCQREGCGLLVSTPAEAPVPGGTCRTGTEGIEGIITTPAREPEREPAIVPRRTPWGMPIPTPQGGFGIGQDLPAVPPVPLTCVRCGNLHPLRRFNPGSRIADRYPGYYCNDCRTFLQREMIRERAVRDARRTEVELGIPEPEEAAPSDAIHLTNCSWCGERMSRAPRVGRLWSGTAALCSACWTRGYRACDQHGCSWIVGASGRTCHVVTPPASEREGVSPEFGLPSDAFYCDVHCPVCSGEMSGTTLNQGSISRPCMTHQVAGFSPTDPPSDTLLCPRCHAHRLLIMSGVEFEGNRRLCRDCGVVRTTPTGTTRWIGSDGRL